MSKHLFVVLVALVSLVVAGAVFFDSYDQMKHAEQNLPSPPSPPKPPEAVEPDLRKLTPLFPRKSLRDATIVWATSLKFCYVDFYLGDRLGTFHVPDDWCEGMR